MEGKDASRIISLGASGWGSTQKEQKSDRGFNGTKETEQASGSCDYLLKTTNIQAAQSPCQERQLIEQTRCQYYLWGKLDERKRLQEICGNSE